MASIELYSKPIELAPWCKRIGEVSGNYSLPECKYLNGDLLAIPEHQGPDFDLTVELNVALYNYGADTSHTNHWWNPQALDISENSPHHWHTDTNSGREYGADMILCSFQPEGTKGTLLSGPVELFEYKERIATAANGIYWVRGDVMHMAPVQSPEQKCANRLLYRAYQERIELRRPAFKALYGDGSIMA